MVHLPKLGHGWTTMEQKDKPETILEIEVKNTFIETLGTGSTAVEKETSLKALLHYNAH